MKARRYTYAKAAGLLLAYIMDGMAIAMQVAATVMLWLLLPCMALCVAVFFLHPIFSAKLALQFSVYLVWIPVFLALQKPIRLAGAGFSKRISKADIGTVIAPNVLESTWTIRGILGAVLLVVFVSYQMFCATYRFRLFTYVYPRLTLHVVDEQGQPIAGAIVDGETSSLMDSRDGRGDQVDGRTNHFGNFSFLFFDGVWIDVSHPNYHTQYFPQQNNRVKINRDNYFTLVLPKASPSVELREKSYSWWAKGANLEQFEVGVSVSAQPEGKQPLQDVVSPGSDLIIRGELLEERVETYPGGGTTNRNLWLLKIESKNGWEICRGYESESLFSNKHLEAPIDGYATLQQFESIGGYTFFLRQSGGTRYGFGDIRFLDRRFRGEQSLTVNLRIPREEIGSRNISYVNVK